MTAVAQDSQTAREPGGVDVLKAPLLPRWPTTERQRAASASANAVSVSAMRIALVPRGLGYSSSPWSYSPGARLSKRVYAASKRTFTLPVGPFRCLATMSSAMPLLVGVSAS